MGTLESCWKLLHIVYIASISLGDVFYHCYLLQMRRLQYGRLEKYVQGQERPNQNLRKRQGPGSLHYDSDLSSLIK